jgi:hypothetical protein
VRAFVHRWRRGVSRGIVVLASAWPAVANAQAVFNPVAQLWPSGTQSASSMLGAFGSAVQCSLSRCDAAPSFGLDAQLVGPLRIAVAGPRSALQYGLSYAWNHIDVATRIGVGASVFRAFKPPKLLPEVSYPRDSLQRVHAETVFVAVFDSSTQDATRWSSAEARLTWRENRWWFTALGGRMAVAQQGAGLWGGLQLGAELGRGASLLFGAATSSRFVSAGNPQIGRGTVSLGFGFNAAIFSRRPSERPAPTNAPQTFVVSRSAPGRIRITIRVSGADAVEFASDCTQWKPVSMERGADGWTVDLPASAGLHHANIRVNGGRWATPPGLTPVDDDFAGEVGIFVVQ